MLKHAESDSSEATDDSVTNPPFRDKADKQMRDGSQRKTEDLALRTSFQLRRFLKHATVERGCTSMAPEDYLVYLMAD